MMTYDFNDVNGKKPNIGFRFGLVGGLSLTLLTLLLLLVFEGQMRSIIIARIIGIILYFVVAQNAAQSHVKASQLEINNIHGVTGTAVGGALVTSLLSWFGLFIIWIVLDFLGENVWIEPFSLFCIITLDGIIASGIGRAIGKNIEKQYSSDI